QGKAEPLALGSDFQGVINRLAHAIVFPGAFQGLGWKPGQVRLAAVGSDGLVDNGPQVLGLTGPAEVGQDQQRAQGACRQYQSFHGRCSRKGKNRLYSQWRKPPAKYATSRGPVPFGSSIVGLALNGPLEPGPCERPMAIGRAGRHV